MADWFKRLWCGLRGHAGISFRRIGVTRWTMFGCKRCGQSWTEDRPW